METTEKQSSGKKKIAILGTGVGALSTAFELTDFPGWEKLYDITIYQLGWRAGGKTASSRGPNNRIQERGIHILQGWYWNMFRLVRKSYTERTEKNIDPSQKFKKWQDAVVKDDITLLTTHKPGSETEWESWPFIFPEDKLVPGDDSPLTWQVMVVRILGIICQLIFGSPYKKRGFLGFIPKFIFSFLFKDYPIDKEKINSIPTPNYGSDPIKNASTCINEMNERLDDRSTLSISRFGYILLSILVWAVFFIYRILLIILWPLILLFTGLRRFMSAFEWILITTKGVLQFCYDWKTSTLVFSKVNQDDYRVFLKNSGGTNMMIKCGLVKFMYYGSFANLKGDKPGILAADIAIRICLDTILYRGALVWKTKAGTGGTIIAPIYQVLKTRGVKFKFFHRIEQIHDSTTGEIESISIVEQLKLKDGLHEYNPLINANNVADWPENPLYNQIDPVWAEKLKTSETDLESSWAEWSDYRKFELKRGVDFDQVVLAIPVNALKNICSEIVSRDKRWEDMVNTVPTTQTFGAQIWLSKSVAQMGFNGPDWGLRTTDEPNSVNYANYLYSWTDMTRILEEENWPDDNKPRDLAYFCGTMPDSQDPLPPFSDHGFPATQYQRVFKFSNEWLQKYMGWFFPNARPENNPNGIDFNLLMNPENSPVKLSGDELIKLQYFTANIDPSNRYTLAWPGTDAHRMKADASGFSNLFLAGDWTNFGLNVGHLEGTCISGIRAASAILKTYTN